MGKGYFVTEKKKVSSRIMACKLVNLQTNAQTSALQDIKLHWSY